MSKWKLARQPSETMKEIVFQNEIIEKVVPGINQMAECVASTLGPNGKNVIIKLNFGNVYTKDGVTVAKHIDFEDKYMSLGAEMVKEVAKDTCDKVGDGTTQSIILVNALINEGLREIKSGKRVDELAKEVKDDVETVIKSIEDQSIQINSPQQTIDIATISANDKELGELVGNIYNKIGKDGVIITEDSGTLETFEEEVDGVRFESGLISPYFINNYERQRSELEDPYIFISDLELSSFAPFIQLLGKLEYKSNSIPSVVIIGDKISGEALSNFLTNHVKGKMKFACIEAPYSKEERKKFLDDLALITGGKFISRDLNLKIADLDVSVFGRANKVISTQKNTTVVGGSGNREEIDKRISLLEEDKRVSKDKRIDLRISKLKNKISVLKVGGNTTSEIREKKYRIEDAVESTKVALNGGIVVGGEMSLINASALIPNRTVFKSIQEPFKRLLINIDKDYSEIIEQVGGHIGYDAAKEEICDLFERGIIDPALVPITALRNASSVAINFLKTGGIVFNIKDLDERTDQPLELD